jgi:hypothetical protein
MLNIWWLADMPSLSTGIYKVRATFLIMAGPIIQAVSFKIHDLPSILHNFQVRILNNPVRSRR